MNKKNKRRTCMVVSFLAILAMAAWAYMYIHSKNDIPLRQDFAEDVAKTVVASEQEDI